MQVPYPLLQTIVVPIFVALILCLIGRKVGKYAGWITCATLMYTTILLCMVGLNVTKGPIYEEYEWAPIAALEFGFLADNLSLPVALIMNLICAALALYSVEYIEHRIHVMYGEDNGSLYALYHALFLFFAVGLVGLVLSTNLIELYFFWELLLIPLYVIMSFFGYIDRERIALMCVFWGIAGGAFFLIGSLLTYSQIGSFRISYMSALLGSPLVNLVCFFILVGILIKMATFGFHVWLPWVHAEHPTCIAGILAAIVGVSSYLMARILIEQLYEAFKPLSTLLMIYALITMVYGAMLTLAQDDIKRLYACSTISQTAYSLLGLASCTALGAAGAIFYFLSHCLGKCVLFSVAGIMVRQTGLRDIKKMGGLAYKMPITATLCVVGSMILSAVPLLSGFQAEWVMFTGIFSAGAHGGFHKLLIAILGITATLLTVAYTFWPMLRVFFGSSPTHFRNVKEAPLTMTGPLIILAVVSLLFGIYPKLVMNFLASWAEYLPIR